MWLQKWHPDFKPEEDSPIVPVWVLLPKLPFHCHAWHYVRQIVAPVGIPLNMDAATTSRTRPGMAKKLEYESVPKFCTYCKKLGHSLGQCRFANKKKEITNEEIEQQTADTVEASKEEVIEENDKEDEREAKGRIEEKAAEVQAAKTKGEKYREKRKQRRRRNALKVKRNKGNGNNQNKEKKQLEERKAETHKEANLEKHQDSSNNNENKDKQFGTEEQNAPMEEEESQKGEYGDDRNSQIEGVSPTKDQHEKTRENQMQKSVVVITTNENEEGNRQDISEPTNPPIKTHNIFQSIANDTGQLDDEIDQGQDTENTISEEMVPGENHTLIMQKEVNDTIMFRASTEKSVTGSSNHNKEEDEEEQFKEDRAVEQTQEDSFSEEEVADSLINAYAQEPAIITEVENQFKEVIEKGNLSPKGTEFLKGKKNKKPSSSTPAVITRDRGRGSKKHQ
ncbi:uncharacterized protein LOC132032010 [Lycium ferocissimum]|uniref:uncharacterized protein LOC132032010 n=1 Tax=Lycium ferocissimum TaxID=112874 RepID=UPI0028169673|nr:uncharacterized protein LOC132032010 [Lycium ferocissimum]